MGMFGNATAITPAKTGKAGKPEKKQIPLEGLRNLAMIDAAIKALEGIRSTYDSQVKASAFTSFVTLTSGARPDSFTGVDGDATCSAELRKRGTNSKLSDEEVALLQKHGITPLKEVTCRELFAINPKYAADSELLGQVEAALSAVVPEDFIVKQDEISKMVVTDENMDAVFASKPRLARDEFEALVRVVSTQALKPKLNKTDLKAVMEQCAKLLAETDSEVEEA